METIQTSDALLGKCRSSRDRAFNSSVFHFIRAGNAKLLARGIVFAVAGQDNDADIVVGGGPFESLTPLVVNIGVEGVVLLGAVEGDNTDAKVMDLDVKGVEMGEDGWHSCDSGGGEERERGE